MIYYTLYTMYYIYNMLYAIHCESYIIFYILYTAEAQAEQEKEEEEEQEEEAEAEEEEEAQAEEEKEEDEQEVEDGVCVLVIIPNNSYRRSDIYCHGLAAGWLAAVPRAICVSVCP